MTCFGVDRVDGMTAEGGNATRTSGRELPAVSVVMSVYNGCDLVEDTIRSILEQQNVDLEFVIVNDGSTDGVGLLLERYAASDPRILLLHQENRGLTQALIRGCEHARGRHIARQDVGDLALPGRLKRQSEYLDAHPGVTLVSCWTSYVGPSREKLWIETGAGPDTVATARLRADSRSRLRGISCHSSAMFRREDYLRVGGYRPQFRVAQDLDLWMRLTDSGLLAFIPECLCEYRYDPESISGRHGREQADMTELIIALRKRRAAGLSEVALLARAERIAARPQAVTRAASSRGYYFLGRMLMRRRDPAGRGYLRQAVKKYPLHGRAWLCLAWYALRGNPSAGAKVLP